MTDTGWGLTEEEAWDALEDLYREGKIDHVPTIGSGGEPAFTMTDEGMDHARGVMRENDAALAMLMQLAVDNADDGEEVGALVGMAETIRDDAGVNVWRRLREHAESLPTIDFEELPERFYEEFDP